jgi:hypothetical protein
MLAGMHYAQRLIINTDQRGTLHPPTLVLNFSALLVAYAEVREERIKEN